MIALSHHGSPQQKDFQSRMSPHRYPRDHAHLHPRDFTGHCMAFVLPQKNFPLPYLIKISISPTSSQQQGLQSRQGWLDSKYVGTCFAQLEPITNPRSSPVQGCAWLPVHLLSHVCSPHSESKGNLQTGSPLPKSLPRPHCPRTQSKLLTFIPKAVESWPPACPTCLHSLTFPQSCLFLSSRALPGPSTQAGLCPHRSHCVLHPSRLVSSCICLRT